MSIWRQQNNTGVFGIEPVGTPSADIPSTGFLYTDAQEFPDELLRGYIISISPISVPFNENSSPVAALTLGLTVAYWLYRGGVFFAERNKVLSVSFSSGGPTTGDSRAILQSMVKALIN